MKAIIIILFFASTTWPTECRKNPNGWYYKEESATSITVELLIVCDKEFGDLFQQDRQKIIDYWTIQLYDVNMRFKTLKSLDVSFRVSQLLTIQNTTKQSFIEKARLGNGTLSLRDLFSTFPTWKYNQDEYTIAKYDIAVVVTGADRVEKTVDSWAYDRNVACSPTNNLILMPITSPWGTFCATLSQALAHTMGAPFDFGPDCPSPDCVGKGYLRSSTCGKNNFFFSNCSDAGIAQFVQRESSKCLRTLDAPGYEVISANTKIVIPPSLGKQCELLTENSSATVGIHDESICVKTDCYIYIDGTESMSYIRSFSPLENSPCDHNKFCFRGRCLPQGYQISNIGNGKCLHSSDRFSSSDLPVLRECLGSPTALDKFMILDDSVSNDTVLLATPYSSSDASENADKCLSIDSNGIFLYHPCSFFNKYCLGWNIVKIDEIGPTFLLYHPYTKFCAAVNKYGDIVADRTCNSRKNLLKWKFVEDVNSTAKWFKTMADVGLPDEDSEDNYLILQIWISILSLAFGALMLAALLFYGLRRYKLSGRPKCSIIYTAESANPKKDHFPR